MIPKRKDYKYGNVYEGAFPFSIVKIRGTPKKVAEGKSPQGVVEKFLEYLSSHGERVPREAKRGGVYTEERVRLLIAKKPWYDFIAWKEEPFPGRYEKSLCRIGREEALKYLGRCADYYRINRPFTEKEKGILLMALSQSDYEAIVAKACPLITRKEEMALFDKGWNSAMNS